VPILDALHLLFIQSADPVNHSSKRPLPINTLTNPLCRHNGVRGEIFGKPHQCSIQRSCEKQKLVYIVHHSKTHLYEYSIWYIMIYIHPTHIVPYIMIYLPFPSQTNLANDLGEYVWCWMGTDPQTGDSDFNL
jgi:hypothetical protein